MAKKRMLAVLTAVILSVTSGNMEMTVYAASQDGTAEMDDLFAPDEEPEIFYKDSYITMVVAADRLNVRSAPGSETDTEILGDVDKGTVLRVLGQDDDEWISIDFGGERGYIYTKYVTIQSQIEAEPEQIVERLSLEPEVEEIEEVELEIEDIEEMDLFASEDTEALDLFAPEEYFTLRQDDVALLAALIQCEAGSEPYEGQIGVGAVVMNRMESGRFPDNLYDVIHQPGQFVPAETGKLDRVLSSGNIYESCIEAAKESLAGASTVGECLYFHRDNGSDGLVIGNHVFY